MQKTIPFKHAVKHRIALITGATSGIGKAFAFEFARQGFDLMLTGRRKEILDQVAEELKSTFHVSAELIIADLTDEQEINRLVRLIQDQADLEVLVNNAGYGIGRTFHKDEISNQLEMIKVHIVAPLMFIHKVMPMMIEKKRGTIINVSSLAAFTPARTNIMYSSTKAFMLNFSESLYLEARNHGIKMQCLCPGYTQSDFHAKLGSNAFPRSGKLIRWMEPDEVVRYSIHCLKRGKIRCIPGLFNRFMVMLISFAPRKVYFFFASMLQQKTAGEEPVSVRKRKLEQHQIMG